MKSDQPLAFQLKSLNNQIRRLLERNAIDDNEAALTGGQHAILGFLSDREDQNVYQRDIEAEFNIRRSTASEMLKGLENKGLIIRVNDTVDTRLKRIIPTETAKELDKKIRANIKKLDARLTRGILPEEMESFYQTMKKIANNAEE